MKYLHSGSQRQVKTPFLRKMPLLRTRKRLSAFFSTREKAFSAEFPAFGATLGVDYDGVDITKANRASSIVR